MTQFNIIETDSTKEFNTYYPQIRTDIKNGLKVKDIKTKYNISNGKWIKYYKELVHEGIIKSRKTKQKNAKFYSKNRGKYVVQRTFNKKKIYYATFKTEKDAKRCVQLLDQYDWDREEIWRIKDIINEENKCNSQK